MSSRTEAALFVGTELGHYRILEKIGSGGMGEVYRARDAHLSRDVAIKILPSGTLPNNSARKQFHKEALLLSQLNHPNIATVHDFDTQDEVDFLVMEYIAGVSLDEKMMGSPLAMKDIVRLGLQLAEGLSAAHERGVIHRDLKPSNLRLTSDGRLKILDFGLAQLHLPVVTGDKTDSMDHAHPLAGTLPYMAPEQLLGEEIDARCDIYSAGVVLYEMATGRHPYAEAVSSQMIAAILNWAPRPPTTLNPNLPAEMERIVGKCMEKEPDNRYQSAKELAIDLRRLERTSDPSGTQSGVFAERPVRRKHGKSKLALALTVFACVLVLALGVFAAWYVYKQHPGNGGTTSIAVLPFEDLSPDGDQAYFSDGLSEEILNDLTKIPHVRVVARSSAFQFKGMNADPHLVGEKLNVGNILEGSVRREGSRVRITARLVQVKDGFQVWSQSYDREVKDVLSVQDEIARDVTSALQIRLSGQASGLAALPGRTSNAEAYRNLLQARYFQNIGDKESRDKAQQYVTRAIELDPSYAEAYALRAGLKLRAGALSWIDYREAAEQARHDVEKALELDPELSGAYRVLSQIQSVVEGDCRTAEHTMRKARDLAPGDADNLGQSGFVAICLGQQRTALELFRQALTLDPLQPVWRMQYGQVLRDLGRYKEAEEALGRTLELSPNATWAHETLGEVYLAQGRYQDALAEMKKESPSGPMRDYGLALAYHAVGQDHQSDALLNSLISAHPNEAAYQIAAIYAYRGKVNEAFAWLQRARDQHDGGLMLARTDLLLKNLHSDPRWAKFLQSLPPIA